MIATTGDHDMTIITLDRLYFVFSYRVALTNAPPMQLRRRVCREAMDILDGSLLSRGVGSEVIWVIFLVGFWCEDTCHTVSSGPQVRWTAPGTWRVGWPKLFSWWSSWPTRTQVLLRTGWPSPDNIMTVLLRLGVGGTLVLGYWHICIKNINNQFSKRKKECQLINVTKMQKRMSSYLAKKNVSRKK
jgi:hypothetical protein